MGYKNFRTIVNLHIINLDNDLADGVAFWFTKDEITELKELSGSAFGMKNEFSGVMVALVLRDENKRTPYMGFYSGENVVYKSLNDFISTRKLKKSIYENDLFLKFENVNNTLDVSISLDDKNYENVLTVKNSGIDEKHRFSISASNSSGKSEFVTSKIRTFSLTEVFFNDENKMRGGNSKVIWIVLVLACC